MVFCTGCYDVLQSGHVIFFNQCKAFGDTLVVGLGRDSTIKKLKGKNKPINNENNRLFTLAALQIIDYVVLNDKKIEEGKIDFKKIIEQLKPDVFVVNDDDSGLLEKKKLCKKLNIQFKTVTRTVPEFLKATSSSEIVEKVKKQIEKINRN